MTGWRDRRLVWNSVLISLPAVMLLAAGVYFLFDKVPQLVAEEQRGLAQEYRVMAVKAKESGDGEEFDFERSGLRRTNLRIMKESWGFERWGLIWYFKDGKAYRRRVEPVDGYDFAGFYRPIVIATLLLFVGMTVFGVRYFWKFVKSRDDFLAATAHDLTTPLVGMRMLIGRDDGEAKLLSERMLLIVGNIKDFLRLGGRRKPELAAVDVVALAREAYRLFAADYEDSEGGAVAFVDAEGRPLAADARLTAYADETMTLQILWNLFGNDLKYAAPYGRVAVRFGREGEFVRIEFADEGRGLSRHQMKRAFDRYYRAQTVLESGKGGFGIGLCTAKEFAEAMGGRLTVRANSPHGCIFALVLPVFSPFNKIAESR